MTSASYTADVLAGVDVQQAVAHIAETGVAAPGGSPAAVDGMRGIVTAARADGIDLSVVMVPDDQWAEHLGRLVAYPEHLRDLSTAIGASEGGTVLAVSPNQVGSFSETYSRFTLESAEHLARQDPSPNATVTAERFVDGIRQHDSIPWTAISATLLALVVLVVAAGTAWNVHRHRPGR